MYLLQCPLMLDLSGLKIILQLVIFMLCPENIAGTNITNDDV